MSIQGFKSCSERLKIATILSVLQEEKRKELNFLLHYTKPLSMSNLSESIGRNVKLLRCYSKHDFAGLCKEARISTGTLSNIEKGLANPTINTICRLAAALHVEPEKLILTQSK